MADDVDGDPVFLATSQFHDAARGGVLAPALTFRDIKDVRAEVRRPDRLRPPASSYSPDQHQDDDDQQDQSPRPPLG